MINILKVGLANILLFLSKTTNELEKKIISLVNVIDKAIDASISKAKFCPRSVLRFNKEYNGAQMRVEQLKKN